MSPNFWQVAAVRGPGHYDALEEAQKAEAERQKQKLKEFDDVGHNLTVRAEAKVVEAERDANKSTPSSEPVVTNAVQEASFITEEDRNEAVMQALTNKLRAELDAGKIRRWEMRAELERYTLGDSIATKRAEAVYAASVAAAEKVSAPAQNSPNTASADTHDQRSLEIKPDSRAYGDLAPVTPDQQARLDALAEVKGPAYGNELATEPAKSIGHYEELIPKHSYTISKYEDRPYSDDKKIKADDRTGRARGGGPPDREMSEKLIERMASDAGHEITHQHDVSRGGRTMGTD